MLSISCVSLHSMPLKHVRHGYPLSDRTDPMLQVTCCQAQKPRHSHSASAREPVHCSLHSERHVASHRRSQALSGMVSSLLPRPSICLQTGAELGEQSLAVFSAAGAHRSLTSTWEGVASSTFTDRTATDLTKLPLKPMALCISSGSF